MSTIVPFNYIGENSEATPGLFNSPLSAISATLANLNANSGSGLTMSVLSDVSTGGGVFTAGPSNLSGAVTIHANSNVTDYLAFIDSSNARSNYLLGSHAGGTADGLNIFDSSGNTMIVSFSKQSIRFYQKIVGPVFDVGGGIFNVKAYGAVGDGVTDDTAAIQLAIDTAGLAGGGVVYIPSTQTSYLVSRQPNTAALVVPYDDVYIQLDPSATIALKNTASATYIIFLGDISNVTQHTNVWVSGGKVSASSSTDATCIRGGWLKNAGCIGVECFGIGGSVGGSAGISFAGVSSTTRSSDVIIADNYLHDLVGTITQDAILTANIDKVAIYGNRTQNTGRAIFLFGAHSDVAVYGNVCRTMADNGIRVSTSNGGLFTDNQAVTITGNVVDGAAIDGIRVDALQVTVSNNVSRNHAQRGIKCDLVQQGVFSGNVVSNNSDEGIYLAPAVTSEYSGQHSQNVIQGNVCLNNVGAGIRIAGGGFTGTQAAVGNAVVGNYCQGNGVGGLEFEDCDQLLIANNTLEANTNASSSANKQGIYVDSTLGLSLTGGVLITGNRAWDLRTSGNRQTRGLRVLVSSSTATRSNVVIRNNDFSNSITFGIDIPTPTGVLQNVSATGNTLLNNVTPFNDPSAAAGGSALLPEFVLSSEVSLGLYRSGASHLALSYGGFSFPAGTALLPSLTFSSESSLGFYRSGTSHIGLSYGAISYPDGTAVLPSMAFSSESSLGFYRSANSVLALSYGTLSVGILAADNVEPASTLTVSLKSSIQVNGAGQVGGPALRHIGAGNYELRHLGSGTFEVCSDNGSLFLSAGTSGDNINLRTGAAPTTRVAIKSGGSVDFLQNPVVSLRTVGASFTSSNVTRNEMVFFIGGASGASLGIRSGSNDTIWWFNSAGSSAATVI